MVAKNANTSKAKIGRIRRGTMGRSPFSSNHYINEECAAEAITGDCHVKTPKTLNRKAAKRYVGSSIPLHACGCGLSDRPVVRAESARYYASSRRCSSWQSDIRE